jgi:hypothetical protein
MYAPVAKRASGRAARDDSFRGGARCRGACWPPSNRCRRQARSEEGVAPVRARGFAPRRDSCAARGAVGGYRRRGALEIGEKEGARDAWAETRFRFGMGTTCVVPWHCSEPRWDGHRRCSVCLKPTVGCHGAAPRKRRPPLLRRPSWPRGGGRPADRPRTASGLPTEGRSPALHGRAHQDLPSTCHGHTQTPATFPPG